VKTHPFIEAEKLCGRNVARTCELLEVSRAAFYARRNDLPSARATTDATLVAEIRQIHQTSGGTYGSPRVHAELSDRGRGVGRRRVTRLMRSHGVVGRHKRRWRTTTVVDPAAERARDLIQRDFATGQVTDRRYVGDITYIATWEGFAYLATVIDLASRRVVGWAIANHMRTSLVEDALRMAFVQRRPERGVIFHTDRGSQYTSRDLAQLAKDNGVQLSVGRTGVCWDNAVAESFFATIKRELVETRPWPTRAGLERAVFAYIEGWYNTRRRHSSLGYKSPAVFEAINRNADQQAA
jgi:transposase InsO family protein